MMGFREFIQEALKPSEYRAVVKNWDRTRFEKLFRNSGHKTDRKAFRIYIPISKGDKEYSWYDNRMEVGRWVRDATTDACKILGINHKRMQPDDYIKGIIRDTRDRPMKIGKILTKAANKVGVDEDRRERYRTVLQRMNNDSVRHAKKDEYMVVISRHPYDIAGMSTGRGWTSCMDLRDGRDYNTALPLDIEKGMIVAYVATTDDPDLKRPVGRVAIKPFIEGGERKNVADNEIFFGIEGQVYGTNVTGFIPIVKDWVRAVNKSRLTKGIAEVEIRDVYIGDINIRKTVVTAEHEKFLIGMIKDPVAFSDNYDEISKVGVKFIFDNFHLFGKLDLRDYLKEFVDYHVTKKRRPIDNDDVFKALQFHYPQSFDGLSEDDQRKMLHADISFYRWSHHITKPKSDAVFFSILSLVSSGSQIRKQVRLHPELQAQITPQIIQTAMKKRIVGFIYTLDKIPKESLFDVIKVAIESSDAALLSTIKSQLTAFSYQDALKIMKMFQGTTRKKILSIFAEYSRLAGVSIFSDDNWGEAAIEAAKNDEYLIGALPVYHKIKALAKTDIDNVYFLNTFARSITKEEGRGGFMHFKTYGEYWQERYPDDFYAFVNKLAKYFLKASNSQTRADFYIWEVFLHFGFDWNVVEKKYPLIVKAVEKANQ